MSDLAIARRYAQALNQEAEATDAIQTTDSDVETVRVALADSPELGRFFASPVISRDKKKAVVSSLMGDHIRPLTLRFINLLIDKRREEQLSDVLAAYRAIRDEQLGIAEVLVRSARALSDEDREAVSEALEKRIGKRVRLTVTLDPGLIGGMVVKVGDTVYDGSVSHRLATLRERMLAGALLN
jgi:F-type H+-transporting ATPase subunit delta